MWFCDIKKRCFGESVKVTSWNVEPCGTLRCFLCGTIPSCHTSLCLFPLLFFLFSLMNPLSLYPALFLFTSLFFILVSPQHSLSSFTLPTPSSVFSFFSPLFPCFYTPVLGRGSRATSASVNTVSCICVLMKYRYDQT